MSKYSFDKSKEALVERTPSLTGEQYLRAHPDSFVREMLARYDRGDFGYLEALELIAADVLSRLYGR